MKFETLNDYSGAIADYLTAEYGDVSKILEISDSQRNVVGGIINYCYDNKESVNNTATYLLDFIKSTNNDWRKNE